MQPCLMRFQLAQQRLEKKRVKTTWIEVRLKTVVNGKVVYKAVAEAFGLKYTPIEQVM